MSLPETVWIREDDEGLWVGRTEEEVVEKAPHSIGVYRLVKTTQRKLVAGDA